MPDSGSLAALLTGLTVLAISHQPRWQDIADKVYYIEPGGQAWSSEDEEGDDYDPDPEEEEPYAAAGPSAR